MWTDDDRAAALALMDWRRREDALRCPRCGTKPADWVDPESGRDLRNPAYVAEIHECSGCRELDDRREDLAGEQDRAGKFVALVPFDPNREDECIPSDDAGDGTFM